jgi:hypothetical protein
MNVEQMTILELKAKLYDLIHASQDVVSDFECDGETLRDCVARLKSTLAQVEA